MYYYSLFQLTRPRFGTEVHVGVLSTYFAYLRHSKKRAFGLCNSELKTCIAGSLPRRERELVEPLESSVATMPGRGKRVNSTAKSVIFNVYKYFERESAKTKNRVPPKLTHKTAEVTGYGECTVRRIVAEKSALSGAAFSSPAKWYKIDREKIVMDDFDTKAL